MPEIKSEKQRGFMFSYFPKARARRYAHETPGGIKDVDLPRKIGKKTIPKSQYGKKYPEKVASLTDYFNKYAARKPHEDRPRPTAGRFGAAGGGLAGGLGAVGLSEKYLKHKKLGIPAAVLSGILGGYGGARAGARLLGGKKKEK